MRANILVVSVCLILAVLVLCPATSRGQQSIPALPTTSENTVLVAGSDSLFLVSVSEVSRLSLPNLAVTGKAALPPWSSQSGSLSAVVLGNYLFVARGYQIVKIKLADLTVIGATLVRAENAPPPQQGKPAAGTITAVPAPVILPPEPALPTSSSLRVPWNK